MLWVLLRLDLRKAIGSNGYRRLVCAYDDLVFFTRLFRCGCASKYFSLHQVPRGWDTEPSTLLFYLD